MSCARFDLSRPLAVHVVGVGGAGMSAIASVLAAMGHRVSGSDLKASPGLDRLAALGVRVHVGHDAAHVAGADVVAISSAIPDRNPEVVAARERGIPVLRRAEILAAIAAQRRTVAVAGTHGKTTTSSMLALVLVEAGLRPSFIIGGDVNEIGSGASWSDGELFVVEADESDGTFVELGADSVVVPNIEPDHLEHYGNDFGNLVAAFERFVSAAPGSRVLCADEPNTMALAERLRADGVDVVTYGTDGRADHRIVDVTRTRTSTTFTVVSREGRHTLEIPVPGLHNARNAVAAFVTGTLLGAPVDAARRALARFAGVARRLQFRGEANGITFVDDYAHLPSEVAAAIDAARDGGWSRVVCVFQPHRYSRTESLWRDFADAFEGADVIAITDVYAAGERPRPGVTGRLVVNAVLDAHPWHRVAYLPRRGDLVTYLRNELRPGDLCLTLGAGDITSLPDEVQAALEATSGATA
ncbi:MAG TPA: UDP-N-acetylmuramate--L-alanine ligase [Acidimicrobiales bacterium]